MKVARTKEELKKEILKVVKDKSIGLVPTMGCLHNGHLSLVTKALELTDFVIVTIFVNPTQFAPGEDFDKYPRTEDDDLRLLENNNVHLVFIPEEGSMYQPVSTTYVIEDTISSKFCGKYRPEHFKGVLTIVAKLINLTCPDKIFMGQKDYQQAVLIRKMIEELDFSVEMVICPIIRKTEGIALSSRNRYLSSDEIYHADMIFQALKKTEKVILNSAYATDSFMDLISSSKEYLVNDLNKIPGFSLQYAEICNAETLSDVDEDTKLLVVLVAGYFNKTRLIDNIVIRIC